MARSWAPVWIGGGLCAPAGDGNTVEFLFEYPDGPFFRTSFTWDEKAKSWRWRMRQKNDAGEWKDFFDATLAPEG